MHEPTRDADRFSTTQWSLVLAAGDVQNPESRDALAALCRTYWYPVYAHIRHLEEPPDRAQDLTQGFFAHLLESGILGVADPEKGRFRCFLKAVLRHYLSHEWRRERTQKRGGQQPTLALDYLQAESDYELEPADERTPETAFEQRWARILLAQVFERLRGQMKGATGQERFRRLEPFLTSRPGGARYKQVAVELEMSESAVKVALHRMRRRFGELLRDEVARTLNDHGEVDKEIHYLFDVLNS